uniref:uncharacterized protein LOC120326814 n=1 Tax=Styela clava TaxID=7725 RepID=UPI00193A7B08|nr:uncharacterized protein LOC120326814 [Styela clava]XP_039249096.1 uncharacterized protein LOC120326814 [Styela clava]
MNIYTDNKIMEEKGFFYDRPYIVEENVVLTDIFNCKTFAWSWCVAHSGVRHTAIVFYLDGVPKYTVNWTPENGVKLSNLLFEVKGQFVFEAELMKDPEDIEYKEPIQSIDVHDELNMKNILSELTIFRFKKYFNSDVNGNAENYDLVGCNCRDHVESVLCNILRESNKAKLMESLKEINELRSRLSPESTIYKLASMEAKKSLSSFIVYASHNPMKPVSLGARKAAGRVFGHYYTFHCLCQDIKLFDTSVKILKNWIELLKQAFKSSFNTDLAVVLSKYGVENNDVAAYIDSPSTVGCRDKCLELFETTDEKSFEEEYKWIKAIQNDFEMLYNGPTALSANIS